MQNIHFLVTALDKPILKSKAHALRVQLMSTHNMYLYRNLLYIYSDILLSKALLTMALSPYSVGNET